MSGRLCLIAAGGTGGHMFPAQALAEEMLRRGWRVRLSTDARGARFAGGFPDAVEVVTVASATFARGGLSGKLAAPFVIGAGIAAAKMRMLLDRPAVVIGFGGYPTIPAMAAAWALRVPRLIHEQNGVPGKVNTVFAKRVNKVACGMWPTALPGGADAVHTGNPVRQAVLDRAGAEYTPPGERPLNLLVIGGSQGARIFSQVVPAAVAALPAEIKRSVRVSHQARPEDLAEAQAAYTEAGIDADVQPFFADVPRRMAEAQLVVSRAGASSVADLTVIGRPSILVPFAAAAGDHQTANAASLARSGAAVVLTETELAPERLSKEMAGILGAPETAEAMARKALAAGRPDAAERLAALVEDLANGQRAPELRKNEAGT